VQAGVRAWVLRAARQGGRGLRTASPTVLLSLLCASAVSPIAVAAAVGAGAVAVAGWRGQRQISPLAAAVRLTSHKRMTNFTYA
jgi:hypothetical protein